MKKTIAVLLAAMLALCGMTALAESKTYVDPNRDITFTYDDAAFEIAQEDVADDELLVVLASKKPEWGEAGISFHLEDLEDGQKFPTLADFKDVEEALHTTVTQGEWNGFKDVFMYDTTAEGVTTQAFIVPVYDKDDGDVEDILTVNINVSRLDDEETGMKRDDEISAVVGSLKLLDD